jgi:hypothetical protein
MKFFLGFLFLYSYSLHGLARTEGEEKIQGYNDHIEEQNRFDKARMDGLDEFYKSKKVDLVEWEKNRLRYIEERKKELANSVSSESGPQFKEFQQEKVKFEKQKELAYHEYQTEKDKVKKEAVNKKMLAFNLKELGLDAEGIRVDPKKRKWTNTVPGAAKGPSFGGGASGGYVPPPSSGGGSPMNDGMDEMEPPPPPPEFDEGESIPVPPVPPPPID